MPKEQLPCRFLWSKRKQILKNNLRSRRFSRLVFWYFRLLSLMYAHVDIWMCSMHNIPICMKFVNAFSFCFVAFEENWNLCISLAFHCFHFAFRNCLFFVAVQFSWVEFSSVQSILLSMMFAIMHFDCWILNELYFCTSNHLDIKFNIK